MFCLLSRQHSDSAWLLQSKCFEITPINNGLLNLLEIKCNFFNSIFQAEYEFKNSNVGGKGG